MSGAVLLARKKHRAMSRQLTSITEEIMTM